MEEALKNYPPEVAQLLQRVGQALTPGGLVKGIEFQGRPEDIILASAAKSGTTWTQHILHGLRSEGNLDFDAIEDVMPFIEFHYDVYETDIRAPQAFSPPQFFTTHLPYNLTPKGAGKYIVVTRNPKDAGVSLFYFIKDWLIRDIPFPIDHFVLNAMTVDYPDGTPTKNTSQFHHVASWYPHRNDENVLWLHYEDMRADMAQCIRMISDFTGIAKGNEKVLKKVEEQSTLEFMKKHGTKFDAHPFKLAKNEAMGLPEDFSIADGTGKVRTGKSAENSKELQPETIERLAARWKEVVEPACGYASYEEMRAAINKERGLTFGSA